jgi:hypothetical protein
MGAHHAKRSERIRRYSVFFQTALLHIIHLKKTNKMKTIRLCLLLLLIQGLATAQQPETGKSRAITNADKKEIAKRIKETLLNKDSFNKNAEPAWMDDPDKTRKILLKKRMNFQCSKMVYSLPLPADLRDGNLGSVEIFFNKNEKAFCYYHLKITGHNSAELYEYRGNHGLF